MTARASNRAVGKSSRAKPGKRAASKKSAAKARQSVEKGTAKKSARKGAKKSTRKSPKKKAPVRKKSGGTKKTAAKRSAANRKAVARSSAGKKSAAKKKASGAKSRAGRRRSPSAFRLPLDVRPTAMDIHINVDPNVSDAYDGEVGINLQLGARRRSIELHACDMRVDRASIRIAGVERRGRVVPHPERETVEICFDRPIAAGHARLELGFSARLRDDLRGLYKVKAGERCLAFSQLAATSARRFVPCFDEPAMKARYRVSVTTSGRNIVLSNSPIESEDLHDDGSKTVHFGATPLLSTYLLALAVGELEHSRAVFSGPTPIRVWHMPGQEGMAEFALTAAAESLRRHEQYFGLPYPYEKLDLVAVPEFEFGAMENPGAVFFRETLLLLDQKTATLAEEKRAAEVIFHELAHMWFGNLVTMMWWDDLWLNEAFATWMAFATLDEWKPEWRVWQTFQHRRAAALDIDALQNTHPIYAPVQSGDEAAENFDLITYEKGASVVRMIERYLTHETFREGVRLYIRRHREANSVAADLWNALSEASGERVEGIVRPWLEQSGHPVVSIRRAERDGHGVVQLSQQRMLLRAPKAGAKGGRTKPGTKTRRPLWPVPMVGRIGTGKPGESRVVRTLLTRARETIPAQGADLTFIYGNAGEGGFYRPHHGDGLQRDLIEELAGLEPIERQGLVDHEWALVRSGHNTLAGLLDLAAKLGADHDPDVLAAVHQPLHSLCKRLAPDMTPASEERLRAWVEVYFGGQVDELGWDPAEGESADTRLRRAEILSIVGLVGEASSVVEEAARRCEAYLEDRGSLDPDLTDVVVSIAAAHGGEDLYDAIEHTMRGRCTPQEERRLLIALADFREPELIQRSLELTTGGDVPLQDVVFLLTQLFANRHACVQTWEFIQEHWSTLREHLATQLGSRLIAATPALLTPRYKREVASFFREHPLPATERALRQALERFDWYAEFRLRVGPQLEKYLLG